MREMDRREAFGEGARRFLAAIAAAKVLQRMAASAVITGLTLRGERVRAEDMDRPKSDAPALVMIHAAGGWDTANGLDPRAKGGEDVEAILANVYGQGRTAGQTLVKTHGPFGYRADQSGVKAFLETHGEELAVMILGMNTNDHGAGTHDMWTGKVSGDEENFASIGALFAKTHGPNLPTPFIVAGGSDKTGSLVPAATLGKVKDLRKVLRPNLIDPNGEARFYPDEVATLIDEFRTNGLEDQLLDASLPGHMEALEQLALVVKGKAELTAIAHHLSSQYPDGADPTIEVVLDLIEFGMVRSVSLAQGGFDTHDGGNQANLPATMGNYFGFVSKLWKRAKERNLAHRILVVGGSEFSRTPNLNGGNGTDHWNGTNTVFLLGQNIAPQVIGASDGGWYAMSLDPKTFKPKAEENGGVVPTIADFHMALRLMLLIELEWLAKFPLTGELDHEALAKKLLKK